MRPPTASSSSRSAERSQHPGAREERSLAGAAPFLLLGLALFGVGVTWWMPLPAGVWHDDGVYMLVGKSLALGHGFAYEGVADGPPAPKFPPLYPTFLGLLWLLLPGIGAVTMAATLFNVMLLAAGGALLAWALHSVGLPLSVSLLAAGLGFASADLLRTALLTLSEPLFLAFTMAAFALWPAAANDEGRRARLGVALLLLLAVLTRSAGVALVAGFAFAFARVRGIRAAVAIAAPALVVTALWTLWASRSSREIPEAMHDLLGPYGAWLLSQAGSAPADFVATLPSHVLGVLERSAAIALPGLTGLPLLAASIPLGLVHAGRRLPPLPWVFAAYLGMLMLWPYLDRRLLVPLHPLLMATLAFGGRALLEALPHPPARRVLWGAASLWVSGYAITTAARLGEGWTTAPYRLRAEQLASAVEALQRTAPPEAIVGAPEFWAALHLHGGWTVAPSARFEPRSADPERPMWGTPEEQIALWRTARIDHLLLEQGGTLHAAALDRLEETCPGTAFVLARMPPLMIVRLEWRETCEAGLGAGVTRSS